MIKRVIFDFLLLISIFIFPWWFNLILIFLGIFIFDNFYEFILFSIACYSLYFVPNDSLSSKIIFPIIIIVSYLIIQFIRKNLFIYKK